MLVNKTMPLFFWNLVYFGLHVVRFTFESSWCSSFFLCLICFFWEHFWVFMFFLCWICFGPKFLFWFVFESTRLSQPNRSTRSDQNWVSLQALFGLLLFFLLRFIWFNVVFGKYLFSLFWVVFISRKNVFLPKCGLIKIQKKI